MSFLLPDSHSDSGKPSDDTSPAVLIAKEGGEGTIAAVHQPSKYLVLSLLRTNQNNKTSNLNDNFKILQIIINVNLSIVFEDINIQGPLTNEVTVLMQQKRAKRVIKNLKEADFVYTVYPIFYKMHSPSKHACD